MISFLPRPAQRQYSEAERQERARLAQRLLAEDSLFSEAVRNATHRVLQAWIEGDGVDSVQVHATMRAFAEVQRSLNIIITDGAVAKTTHLPRG